MYCTFPHLHIGDDNLHLTAVTGRRKPYFLLFETCEILGIKDYSLVFKTLEDHDVDTLIDHIDWNEFMPFDIVTTEGVLKLIEVSPLPDDKKEAIRDWFEKEVIPLTDLAWAEKLEPLWKPVETDRWFSGVECVMD